MGPAFYRDVQVIVVAMPVFIGAFSKGRYILLLRPFVHPKFMGGIKAFYASDIYHECNSGAANPTPAPQNYGEFKCRARFLLKSSNSDGLKPAFIEKCLYLRLLIVVLPR